MIESSPRRVADYARPRSRLTSSLVASAALASVATVWLAGSAGAATATVTITPQAGQPTGPYSDGETVTVGVGPSSTFPSGTRVNILECADPGGSPANLPKNNTTCDGLTIQGDTVLVRSNGSISAPGYTLYRLPSPTLGEQASAQPVCDQNDLCVLYVGENQDDFSAPKVFSAPFAFSGSSAGLPVSSGTVSSAPAGGGTGPSGSALSGRAGALPATNPGVALQGGSLAYTGLPPTLARWGITGCALFVVGAAGRIWLRRAVYS